MTEDYLLAEVRLSTTANFSNKVDKVDNMDEVDKVDELYELDKVYESKVNKVWIWLVVLFLLMLRVGFIT